MLCGWKGNYRFGVALAMRHRLSGIPYDREMSTPPAVSLDYGTFASVTYKSLLLGFASIHLYTCAIIV